MPPRDDPGFDSYGGALHSIAQSLSQSLHSAANTIHCSRHGNIQNHGNFVIAEPLGLQVHAFPLQLRQPQDLLFDEPDPFVLEHLLLGIGGGITLRLATIIGFRMAPGPIVMTRPLAVDPQVPGNAKDPPSHVADV